MDKEPDTPWTASNISIYPGFSGSISIAFAPEINSFFPL